LRQTYIIYTFLYMEAIQSSVMHFDDTVQAIMQAAVFRGPAAELKVRAHLEELVRHVELAAVERCEARRKRFLQEDRERNAKLQRCRKILVTSDASKPTSTSEVSSKLDILESTRGSKSVRPINVPKLAVPTPCSADLGEFELHCHTARRTGEDDLSHPSEPAIHDVPDTELADSWGRLDLPFGNVVDARRPLGKVLRLTSKKSSHGLPRSSQPVRSPDRHTPRQGTREQDSQESCHDSSSQRQATKMPTLGLASLAKLASPLQPLLSSAAAALTPRAPRLDRA